MTSIKLQKGDEIRRLPFEETNIEITFDNLISKVKDMFDLVSKEKDIRITWRDDENDEITMSTTDELKEAMRIIPKFAPSIRFFVHEVESRKEESVLTLCVCSESGEETKFKMKADTKMKKIFDYFYRNNSAKTNQIKLLCDGVQIFHEDTPGILGLKEGDKIHIHSIIVGDSKSEPSKSTDVIHHGIVCDGCNMDPIVGVRYKCTKRYDFDLCEGCEEKDSTGYPMIKILSPDDGIFCAWPRYSTGDGGHGIQEGRFGRSRGGGGGRCGQGHFGGRLSFKFPPGIRQLGKIHALRKEEKAKRWAAKVEQLQAKLALSGSLDNQMNNRVDLKDLSVYGETKEKSVYEFNKPPEQLDVEDISINDAITRSLLDEEDKLVSSTMERSTKSDKNKVCCHIPSSKPSDILLPKPALRFVRDVSYPDGIVVPPGTVFTKCWRVRNDGHRNWPEGVHFCCAGGDILCSPNFREPLDVLKSGEETNISVQLRAPDCSGRFVSYFKVENKDGQGFGQRLWSSIIVSDDCEDWHLVRSAVSTVATEADETVDHAEKFELIKNLDIEGDAQIVSDVDYMETQTVGPSTPVNGETETGKIITTVESSIECASVGGIANKWTRELSILSNMGFKNEEELISLLQTHCHADGVEVDHHGLQTVVGHLLPDLSK